jgi:2-keto-3-deoxy-6-phosphogluconate aldolase
MVQSRYNIEKVVIPVDKNEIMNTDTEIISADNNGTDQPASKEPSKSYAPSIRSRLRHNILEMPPEIRKASGILIFGRRIKSLVFTTDLAIIKNCDADAIFAVYPFTPQQSISDAIIRAANVPVFTGVGGGTTRGLRTVSLAKDCESQGAMGVVLNAPITNSNLRAVSRAIDIPVIITVINENTSIRERLRHGATIINVAGGKKTPDIVRRIREQYPEVPIIATGGNTPERILATIEAGANAITYTPPSIQDLFSDMMDDYREKREQEFSRKKK